RAEVVRLLEVDGVDVVEVDEVLDLDRAGPLRIELGELVLGQEDVLVRRVLVALDDLLVGDLLAVGLGHALVANPRAVALAELAEADGLLGDRAVELHGHVQQPEADRSTPNGPSQAQSPRSTRSTYLRLPLGGCAQPGARLRHLSCRPADRAGLIAAGR